MNTTEVHNWGTGLEWLGAILIVLAAYNYLVPDYSLFSPEASTVSLIVGIVLAAAGAIMKRKTHHVARPLSR